MYHLHKNVGDEHSFLDTVNGNKRSLCLVKAHSFEANIKYWQGDPALRITLTGNYPLDNPKTQDKAYPIKDCKWEGLMFEGFKRPYFKEIIVCIGLARPSYYDGVAYPQVIGLHTLPNIAYPRNYPD